MAERHPSTKFVLIRSTGNAFSCLYDDNNDLMFILNNNTNPTTTTTTTTTTKIDCIRNYPDKNLPTLLIYFEDDLKRQLVGVNSLGGPDFSYEGNTHM